MRATGTGNANGGRRALRHPPFGESRR
jgi:hypothetical protein